MNVSSTIDFCLNIRSCNEKVRLITKENLPMHDFHFWGTIYSLGTKDCSKWCPKQSDRKAPSSCVLVIQVSFAYLAGLNLGPYAILPNNM